MQSRREFVKATLAGAGVVAWGQTAPLFLSRTALAAGSTGKPGTKETVLVVVQLTGGNDGLNTVVPFSDDGYDKLRKDLRLPTNDLKKINDSLGLHPSLGGLAELLEDHALCVVQGVGYPNPNESHFRSMDIWQAASLAENLTEGWLGKALVQMPASPAFHVAAPNEQSWLTLAGAPAKVPSITNLQEFQLQTLAASGADHDQQRQLIERDASRKSAAGEGTGQPALLDFVRHTAVNTYANSQRLRELAKNYQPKVPYPASGLSDRLKLVAQLIEADFGARIFYVTLNGFDTHANQLAVHANLLRELSDAAAAFFKDMSARGHRDRIMMMTFSEFGRRAKENQSQGTDHGSAAPMFLIGGRVRSGVVGAHPSLSDLYMDKLKHHTDFRQVYAAVLDQWLGVSSKQVLGGDFKPVEILRG
ncbi:MAG TPA: DUF1501 domain-containing protein [Pirellulales bacterium]|jgi:uncharacterized protein (DUF1501 family)|nr:DUF1501 domain-containing protein [Pirellulales bacterium]